MHARRRRSDRSLRWLLLLLLPSAWSADQNFDFRAPGGATDANVPAVMRDLAERVLPVYQENDPERYLTNLSALQLVAGNYSAANATREQLRDRRRNADSGKPVDRTLVYDLYARARSIEASEHVTFAQAFMRAFGDFVPHLSDRDDYTFMSWLETPVAVDRDALQRAFDQRRSKGSLSLPEAIDLIWAYLNFDAAHSSHPYVEALEADDDARRYVTEQDLLIEIPGAGSFSAVLVRPKDDTRALPTLLEFTIDVSAKNAAKESAAHGYAGVVAYGRGKRRSPGEVVPFERDGDDARAVIGWIARQPWSDGRVAMYGTSYSGFTAWAAAKRLPGALKAIATAVPMAPGIEFPMVGAIFRNSSYRWAAYVADTEGLDRRAFYDEPPWKGLDPSWYESGKPYRDLDRIIDRRSHIFERWLSHPSFDHYWQKLVPYGEQFAHINIPVLTIAGYYGAGEIGALYYAREHRQYHPRANHTLLIGPYDDGMMDHPPAPVLRGYTVDPVALVDLRELRYQWFDYVLKGTTRPPLLQDRVNYQLMGANTWEHAPSLEALSKSSQRFYLESGQAAGQAGDTHVLAAHKAPDSAFVAQTLSLIDRSDANWAPPGSLIGKTLPVHNGVTFVSEPLRHTLELAGLLSGKLEFSVNKADMDLALTMYELLPNGDYLQLAAPYEIRASYAAALSHRQLLKPGERQQLAFKSERMLSRRLQVGSRVVLVLSLNKRPDQEINYGTGNDVSGESIAEGKAPIKVRWFGASYLDLPVRR
jgi:putative CocE/NonD family hydrolase